MAVTPKTAAETAMVEKRILNVCVVKKNVRVLEREIKKLGRVEIKIKEFFYKRMWGVC